MIAVRPLSANRPRLNGSLTVNGAFTEWRDLEICYTGWTTRQSDEAGAAPSDIPLSRALAVNGEGVRFVNCVIHDLAVVGCWTPAVDAEFYGCLIYNIGWQGTDTGHGHAMYTQNATGTKRFRNCVFGKGYSLWGVHAYTESGSIQGFEFEDCVHYPARFLVGGGQPVDRLTIRRSHLLGALQLGYLPETIHGSATLESVTAAGALDTPGDWGTGDERITQADCRFSASGLNEVYVTANEYDDDRAKIVIYNAALANTVDVDFSALPLTIGREYVLRNAQDYFAAGAQTFTYTGAAVAVGVASGSVAVPIGSDAPLTASTLPAWGCFILERAP